MHLSGYHIAQHLFSGWRILLLALLVCLILFVADLSVGSVGIPFSEVINILTGGEVSDSTWEKIVLSIRLPKTISAVLAGMALAVAGLQMQTLFHNPLAGPSVLGVTAGASLGVAVVMLTGGGAASLFTIRQLGIGGTWLVMLASSAGAAMVMGLILLISMKLRDNVSLLIVGIMIGNITIAVVSIWQYFSSPEQLQDYLIWTFGSLGGVTGKQLPVFITVTIIGAVLTFLNSKSLNTLLLGENYARSMGINIFRTRIMIIITASILAGAVTGFCGPIAFIGIAVPHLVRSVAKTSDHRVLIPMCLLTGAALLLLCDLIAQVPGTQIVLPINAITALVGSPVVIWVIIKNKNLKSAF